MPRLGIGGPALWLIACALMLRIAVPIGWMPAADAFGLMPCFGMIVTPMAHSMPGHDAQHHKGSEKTEQHPCAFSSIGHVMADPHPVGLLLPVTFVVQTIVDRGSCASAIGRGLAAPPPPPTGPPPHP